MEVKILIIAAFAWIILLTGCDWPRDNPLDPKSVNYGITDPADPEKPVLIITSFHSSQWFPSEDYYALEIEVSGYMTDVADSVVFVYDDTTCYQLNRESDIWRASIESSVFPDNSISNLIGQPFIAVLYQDSDSIAASEESYLFRLIETVPLALQPSGNIEVSPTPVFSWQPVYENFSFTYLISIISLSASGYATVAESISGIAEDLTTYTLTDSLPTGSYYWTVAIVDNFGNKSRSKEAAFMVAE